MLVPITSANKNNGGSLLLLLNRFINEGNGAEGLRKFINFNAYSLLVSNKLF